MQIRLIKKHKGIGDTIASVAKVTGISYIANAISNGDSAQPCSPCSKRQENLNDPDLLVNKIFYGAREDSTVL